jgi:hypothetical protein
MMRLSGVKILEQSNVAMLLVSRTDGPDVEDLHRFLTERGYVRREGPRPADVNDEELGLCQVFWLRTLDPIS